MKFLVLDYLISQGYREAAEYLCEDASIPFPRDAIENLDQRMRIRDDIIEGKVCLINSSSISLSQHYQFLVFIIQLSNISFVKVKV